MYNYFIPFCAAVKTITRGALDDSPDALLPKAEGTDGMVVLTGGQKGMKKLFCYPIQNIQHARFQRFCPSGSTQL